MDFLSWLQILLLCIAGAMSPGPSLAIVLRNTISGGKRQGVLCAIGHGLGIFFYAVLVVAGLGVAFAAAPTVEKGVGYAGVALLVWLGLAFMGLKIWPQSGRPGPKTAVSSHGGFISGFLIAFLNPKVAVFFLAVFGSILRPETTWLEKAILAVTAGTVDALWFVLVALVISGTAMSAFLEDRAAIIDKAIGGFLLVIAAALIYRMW